MLRITVHLPTTAENIEKARNFVESVNRDFERRGLNRRARLFAGNVEERVITPQVSLSSTWLRSSAEIPG